MDVWRYLIAVLHVCLHEMIMADVLPTCQPEDFHYEYTECDAEGGRWRVSVPYPNTCVGGAPNPPVRGQKCEFTCDEGEYLDIQGDQECHKCPPGTYSLGGGERFEDWDSLPNGFSVKSEGFSGHKYTNVKESPDSQNANCNGSSWMPRGNYLAAMPNDCSAVLTYSTTLVKAGVLHFTYQYTDDAIFHFMVQNDQCQTVGDRNSNRWLSQTDEGEWKTVKVDLKSGLNLLTWKAMGVGNNKSQRRKQILIRTIEITGVAFTSECTKCKEGTYSAEGASSCEICPENTFSKKGASDCSVCDSNKQYSEPGSSECLSRPPCSEDDYYEYNSPCDVNNQTQVRYNWIEPKICQPQLPESVQLPDARNPEPCPPCNPGMEQRNGSCHFCPPNTYSDGSLACQQCPASTAPQYALEYKWWTSLPPEANISSSCLSMNERGCTTKTGWQTAVDHIYSGRGHADDAYLVLVLKLGGFRGTEQVLMGKAAPVGKITFVFELDCTGECTLFFMQQSRSRGTAVVETWTGKTNKMAFVYELTKTEPVVFSWAFQKSDWDEDTDGSRQYRFKNDIAKIYSIAVTNTIDGAASKCQSCPKGSSRNGCIPCPAGHYIDSNSTQCVQCPPNTIVHGAVPWGQEACVECGEGLHTVDHMQCSTTCSYTSPDGKYYDFSTLGSPTVVSGSRLFTASGTQYYHIFNISLCGGAEFPQATCHDNISYELGEEVSEFVSSLICRTTMIPPRPNEEEGVMSAQPVSLGNVLINITSNHSSLNMLQRMKMEGFSLEDSELDVHFTYLSEESTTACHQGRTTVITLRCDISQPGTGVIDLPPRCSDGTCDGCNFHFLWRTRKACPVCKEEDYDMVVGVCKDGVQTIHYIPPKHCVLMSDTKPVTKTRKCSPLPFWLEIAIICIVAVGILMCILVIYCWKKNRKLEYKYMKLIHSNSSSKEGELPAAETCALDEGEDDEQFDSVEFKESKGKKLFNKIKNMTKKGDFYEVSMEHSSLLN